MQNILKTTIGGLFAILQVKIIKTIRTSETT